MARSPGPLRKYTITFIWPSCPGSWREAVVLVDEKTARASFEALRRMHYAVRVAVTFQKPNTLKTFIATYPTGEWDRVGRVVYRHEGERAEFMPAWCLGLDDKKVEKKGEQHDGRLGAPVRRGKPRGLASR